jgi:hypothetical protein
MGGSEAETIHQPRDRLKGQPQEGSLIAGPVSTAFRFLTAQNVYPYLGGLRCINRDGWRELRSGRVTKSSSG